MSDPGWPRVIGACLGMLFFVGGLIYFERLNAECVQYANKIGAARGYFGRGECTCVMPDGTVRQRP